MEGGFGARVALFRRRKGLSQRALARAVGRSESWMSQVERDIIPVGRLSVLHRLADALDVSIYDLEPAGLDPPPETPAERADRAPVEALDGLRSVIVGHPDLGGLLSTGDGGALEDVDTAELARSVDEAWAAARRWALVELGQRLAAVIPDLEAAARAPRAASAGTAGTDGTDGTELSLLLARAYRAAATAFTFAGEADAAWVAADRAMAAAESAGDRLGVVAGLYRMAHAFVRDGRFEPAERALDAALDALGPLVDDGPAPAVLALTGSLHLLAGVAAAREGQRTKAHDHVEAARALAGRLVKEAGDGAPTNGTGTDADRYETEFGPANVEAHAVAVAVELGDAGMAVDIARRVDASALSAERQARLLVDVARAQTQRRQLASATEALLDAEELAPELVAGHPIVREAVRQLMEQAPEASEDLRALAHRTSALPP
jgi:transcriptional regulator with XRE-family HTH domain